jgi:CRP-like cAMP-binding protein
MNNPLSKRLNETGNYSNQDLILIEDLLNFKIIEKDELILDVGEICSEIHFIDKGAIYQYKINSDLNKMVIDLNISNDWVVNHKSFTLRKPSEFYIQAFEKTSIYSLSVESIHKLIAQSQSFLQMGKILEEATSRVSYFDENKTPYEKYEYLLKNKREVIQIFPLKIIASYLKITPETLSRVRKRIK